MGGFPTDAVASRRLPLWKPYAKLLESKVADTSSISDGAPYQPRFRGPFLMIAAEALLGSLTVTFASIAGPYGGAITAALFLQNFVSNTSSKGWVHIDLNAWCAFACVVAMLGTQRPAELQCLASSAHASALSLRQTGRRGDALGSRRGVSRRVSGPCSTCSRSATGLLRTAASEGPRGGAGGHHRDLSPLETPRCCLVWGYAGSATSLPTVVISPAA